jgi:hypothetical protein
MLAALQSIKETCRSEPRNNEAAAVRISLLVRRIGELSSTDSVIRDGNWVISRAFDRYSPVDNTNKMVRAARLHAAVARFELSLRQQGFLPERRRSPRIAPRLRMDAQGPAG